MGTQLALHTLLSQGRRRSAFISAQGVEHSVGSNFTKMLDANIKSVTRFRKISIHPGYSVRMHT